MLSILIPTFNYDSVPLVKELHKQCITCNIEFEILVFDDGSKASFINLNNTINTLHNCVFKALPNNIGRSAIRNLLAKNAKYNALLFVDAGTFPKNKYFIKTYIDSKTNVVNGGMTCSEVAPKKPFKLRWLFTKYREQNALCSSNFLIRKSFFETYPFDETIKTYGYEDVLFFDTLENNNVSIEKINNPVIHASDDDAISFLNKTELAIENLIFLLDENKINKKTYRILIVYDILNKIKLTQIIGKSFSLYKKLLIKNFNSSYPSIFLFDFYRLSYFCYLKTKK